MNWTASLLRNQLKRQKLAYEERINLLTNASIDVQNFLDLEEKVKELTAELKDSEQKLTNLKKELANKEQAHSEQLETKELAIKGLEQKIKEYKDRIFTLQKEIRELNLYHQKNLKEVKENYQSKLTPLQKQIAELKQSIFSVAQNKLKGKKEQEKILTELETNFEKEKEQISKEHSAKISELNQSFANLEQSYQLLQKQAKKQEKHLEKLTTKQEKVQQILTNSQSVFQQIEKIINRDTTIVLASKKKIRSKVEEFKHLLGWGATEIEESEEEIISSPEISPLPEPIITVAEPVKKLSAKEKRWQNINSNFTSELIQEWESKNFTLEECRSWININSPQQQNQAIQEVIYYAWLRDIKKKNAEWMLNHGNAEQLKKEFNSYDKR